MVDCIVRSCGALSGALQINWCQPSWRFRVLLFKRYTRYPMQVMPISTLPKWIPNDQCRPVTIANYFPSLHPCETEHMSTPALNPALPLCASVQVLHLRGSCQNGPKHTRGTCQTRGSQTPPVSRLTCRGELRENHASRYTHSVLREDLHLRCGQAVAVGITGRLPSAR